MQKRNILNSPRLLELKKRRKKVILNKIVFSLIGVLLVFILLGYASRVNGLNIIDLKINGNKIITTESIETAINEELAGKYFWLFPKTNVLFYPQKEIKTILLNKFKRIADLTLEIKNRKTLEVSINERTAKYTWCGRVVQDSSNANQSKCYFLDDTGYIFDEAPYFSGSVYFKFYGLTENATENPIGSYFDKNNFNKLISFKENLEKMGLKPVSLWKDNSNNDDAGIELASNKENYSPKIFFRLDSDFQNISENLEAALTTEPLQTEFNKKYSALQYLDLRFGNKVYYKFK